MATSVNRRLKLIPRTSDRRFHQRFPISARVEYVVAGVVGEGVTLNISSGGALVRIAQRLPIGKRIQLSVDWPVKLDNRIPLRFVVKGTVLRSTAEFTAVAIVRHEYFICSGSLASQSLLSA